MEMKRLKKLKTFSAFTKKDESVLDIINSKRLKDSQTSREMT